MSLSRMFYGHMICLLKFPHYLYLDSIVRLDIVDQMFKCVGNYFLLGALITLGAHFGRPSLLHLRNCNVVEPTLVDDNYITCEAIVTPPPSIKCRMSAFLVSLWIMVVLESILDALPACKSDQSDSFLLCATNLLHGMWKFRLM